jgi:hypothetical protein
MRENNSVMFTENIKRYRIILRVATLLVCISLCLSSGCLHQQEEGDDGGLIIEDYFRGDFTVTGEPILYEDVEITLILNPPLDSMNTEVLFDLPEGIEIVEGNKTWKGDILSNETARITITVRPIQEGELFIQAYVKGLLAGEYEKDFKYYLYFLTAKNSGKVSRTRFYPQSVESKGIKMVTVLVLKIDLFLNVGEEAVLTCKILASEDTENVRVVIELPEEFIILDGPLEWTGDLEKEKEVIFHIRFIPTEAGKFEILGHLSCDKEEYTHVKDVWVD